MDRSERALRLVAVQASALVAAAHLLWAAPRLPAAAAGESADARPTLFLVSGLFLLAIAVSLYRGTTHRRLDALGAGTLLTLLTGFAWWHTLGPGRDGGVPAALASDPLAAVAVAAGAVGCAAFAGLYYVHHPDRPGPSSDPGEGRANGTDDA